MALNKPITIMLILKSEAAHREGVYLRKPEAKNVRSPVFWFHLSVYLVSASEFKVAHYLPVPPGRLAWRNEANPLE
jgi:hypothetical protein